MKTLEEIKQELANDFGRSTFKDLLRDMAKDDGEDGLSWLENTLDEIARLYAKEAVQEVGSQILTDFNLEGDDTNN